ncbi:hypothetical protein [Francisella sp. 19X1-34]|uniref:hypothetical protein n=1 Tax=Francisella sp. 19X1-34 TaxID=3087177 RepID=UPI002E36D6E5|nr:hypothetical protein [Francisella sp. 19X1-34]MED7789390.1 hypothetical protein [Francisella sp. 19X1-34]
MRNKLLRSLLVILVTIGLVACSEPNKAASQSVTFTGDYVKSGFKLGEYGTQQGALSLSAKQVKITCPDGYVIPPNLKPPSFGSKFPKATCDRKDGCQIVTILLINSKTFSVKKMSIVADKLTDMQANNNIALGAMCVKKDQVKDWV